MFEGLAEHDIILVTGPQRSGTQICARMIAQDTNRFYVDEARFNIWDYEKALAFAEENKPCVVQGPGLIEEAHVFDNVVIMERDVADISRSMKNAPALVEKLSKKYPECGWFYDRERILPILMYTVFYHCTAYGIENLVQIAFEDLSSHPLWVPKERRIGWKFKQWRE
jgi:hypothetical protein